MTSKVQEVLEKELKRLSVKLGLNEKLMVVWMPDSSKKVSGEVKEGIIYIHEENENKAVKVLKHEVLDYILTSRIVNPLVNLVNLLITSRANEIYREKEKIVDSILSLFD